jgi:hypothetical protein
MFVGCKDYDDSVDITYSKNEKFKLEIKRKVEPKIMKVHDLV